MKLCNVCTYWLLTRLWPLRSGDAPAADAEGSGAMDLELADGAEAEGEEEESLEAKNARVEELCKPADPEMPENKTCAHRQQGLFVSLLVLVSSLALGCTDRLCLDPRSSLFPADRRLDA